MRWVVLALVAAVAVEGISDDEFFNIQRAQRQVEAHTIKANVARYDESKPLPNQQRNGDEQRYADLRGSFNKGLIHQPSGFPNHPAFESMVKALSTGLQNDFNAIQIDQGDFVMVNPQASLCYALAGNDGWINAIPPAPTFASAQTAGEMVEVYWTALKRDVPFNLFSVGTVGDAVDNLNTMSDFRGPKMGGLVTPETFLRGNTPGDLVGPYISQFLYLPIPWGSAVIGASTFGETGQVFTVPTPAPDNTYMTDFTSWLNIITGGPAGTITEEANPIFIRTPRDLTEYVHRDTPGQAALGALLILDSFGPTALDPAIPYLTNRTQDGFVTFGIGEWLAVMREAVQEGLKSAWYHKWQVNRRCRPEEYGFYLQQQVVEMVNLGIHPDLSGNTDLFTALDAAGFTDRFLPMAYPEGSPVHPSYPAGHATFIGAAVTVLKAIFNESFEIPDPIEPNGANNMLVTSGETLTVGGELNKLAANISLGRDHAGVHYRSDGFDGMNLGEQVAIDVLNNSSFLFNEGFSGFTLTKFDGTTVTVGQKRETF